MTDLLAELAAVYGDSLAALSATPPDLEQVAVLATRADQLVAALAQHAPTSDTIDAWRETDRLRTVVAAMLAEHHAELARTEASEHQRQQQAQAYAAMADEPDEPRFLDTRS